MFMHLIFPVRLIRVGYVELLNLKEGKGGAYPANQIPQTSAHLRPARLANRHDRVGQAGPRA
jgi:hypothetical protein